MPKKKGGSKKGAKIIDGLNTNEMSREQLLGHIKRIQLELDREREERNFFMLEREKLFSLWTLSLDQIGIEKQKCTFKDVQISESQKDNEEALNVYKQKLRYMMAEQTKKLGHIRLDHLKKIKRIQEELSVVGKSCQESVEEKNRELSNNQLSMYQLLTGMVTEHSEKILNLERDYGMKIREIEASFERRLYEHNEESEVAQSLSIERIDLSKCEQIDAVIKIHEEQIGQLKKFYNELTINNFAVIASLKDNCEKLQNSEDNLKREIGRITKSHEKMAKLVLFYEEKIGKNELENGAGRTGNYLKYVQASKLEKQIKRVEYINAMSELANETLAEKLSLVEKEREDLRENFIRSFLEMQKKEAMRKIINEVNNRTAGASGNAGERFNFQRSLPNKSFEEKRDRLFIQEIQEDDEEDLQ